MLPNPRAGTDRGLAISKDGSDLADEKQVVGRKIWRVVPYLKRYWRRAAGGVVANAAARAFDLIPFIAIGAAADYYRDKTFTASIAIRLVVASILMSCCTM